MRRIVKRLFYRNKIMKYLLLIGCLALPVQFASAQDPASAPAAAPSPTAAPAGFSGKVVETMNTAGYTYVLVDTGSQKVWAAAVQFAVKQGDSVSFSGGDPMPNFHSKTLNRDFDVIYFTGGITVNETDSKPAGSTPALPPGHPPLTGEKTPALPPGHPSLTGQAAKPDLDLTGIKRADGGKIIMEIFAGQKKLAGKPVSVRGKVVKYNEQIMGKNWLHIRDGSGSAENGDNDLTITTTTPAKLGDIVLVTGKLAINKDFGAGYKYTVIIDDAKVTVE